MAENNMAFPYPQNREQVEQLRAIPDNVAAHVDDWSEWERLMVPGRNHGGEYRNRNSDEGSYREGTNLPGTGVCGIYEWKIVNPKEDTFVVYLGSSCSGECAPLKHRILQYCKNGGHKARLINHVLKQGYELHVRYQPFENPESAGNAEDYLLGWYNYAWNILKNGIREPVKKDGYCKIL